MLRVLGLAVALASCGGNEPSKPHEPKREDPGGSLRLVESGAEPRASVRWRPTVGKSRTLIFTTRDGARTRRDQVEIRLPTITPSGDFRYEATLQRVDLVEAPDSDEERRLKNAQGSLLAATVTRLGRVRESSTQGEPSVRSLEAWLRWGVVPFPDVPLGSGAVWESENERGHTRWELVANDGLRAVVRFQDEISEGGFAAAGPTAEGEVVLDLTRAPVDKLTVAIRRPPGVAANEITITALPREASPP